VTALHHRQLVCALLAITALTSSARAQTNERWLFVPVFSTSSLPPDLPIAQLPPAFEREVKRERDVLEGPVAAIRFEDAHSSEPVRVSDSQLERLLQIVGEGRRFLALGKRKKGQGALQSLDDNPAPIRDFLQREPQRAELLFDACLTTGYLLVREKQTEQAEQQLLRCAQTFPDYEPRRQPAEIRKMYESAREQAANEPHGSLEVVSTKPGCSIRLSGMERGKSPTTLRVTPGVVRLQLECERDTPGRIHAVEVRAGSNHVTIDPRFEAAVHSQGALWLAYPDATTRTAEMDSDGRALGKILGATRVVLLVVDQVTPDALSVRVRLPQHEPSQDIATIGFSNEAGYAHDTVEPVARKLVALTPATSPAPQVKRAVLVRARLAREPAPPADTDPPTTSSAPRVALGVVLAVAGVGALSTSWAFYATRLSLRSRPYIAGVDYDTARRFDSLGVGVLIAGAGGAALITGSEWLLVPGNNRIPTVAWVVGGAGVALAATGLGFVVVGTHCRPHVIEAADSRRSCGSFVADSSFGPLLALHALPLLNLPLEYAVRRWLGSDDIEISFDGTRGLVSWAGVF
jgi:hypothetical protein